MQSLILNQDHVAHLIQILNKVVGAHTTYVFGYRDNVQHLSVFPNGKPLPSQAPHFDLLVFAQKTGDGLSQSLAGLISERSNGAVTATVLLHKTAHLQTQSVDMQWFFDTIVRRGIRIGCDRANYPILERGQYTRRNFESVQAFWHKCEAVASVYLEAASESQQLDVELVKTALLTQATEYLLLGLIRIFTGYIPVEHNLKFLFALCAHFTDLPRHIFEGEGGSSRRRLQQLCAPPTMLRHWDELQMPEADFDLLLEACLALRVRAGQLAMTELEKTTLTTKTLPS